jgi:hypothetical protein
MQTFMTNFMPDFMISFYVWYFLVVGVQSEISLIISGSKLASDVPETLLNPCPTFDFIYAQLLTNL